MKRIDLIPELVREGDGGYSSPSRMTLPLRSLLSLSGFVSIKRTRDEAA